ncbi:hypothetical protein JCM10207_006078 [Rhodosporidiobolus poonsookiae]
MFALWLFVRSLWTFTLENDVLRSLICATVGVGGLPEGWDAPSQPGPRFNFPDNILKTVSKNPIHNRFLMQVLSDRAAILISTISSVLLLVFVGYGFYGASEEHGSTRLNLILGACRDLRTVTIDLCSGRAKLRKLDCEIDDAAQKNAAPTAQDLMTAINHLSTDVSGRFDTVDTGINNLGLGIGGLGTALADLKTSVGNINAAVKDLDSTVKGLTNPSLPTSLAKISTLKEEIVKETNAPRAIVRLDDVKPDVLDATPKQEQ